MSAAESILSRLHNVKAIRPGQWKAGCPCCQSRKGQPIAVSEAGDGRVLINAFCGCDTGALLNAVGLQFSDLFPAPLTTHAAPAKAVVPARDVLLALNQEVTVVAIIAHYFLERRTISEDDWTRLAAAVRRIGAARDYV